MGTGAPACDVARGGAFPMLVAFEQLTRLGMTFEMISDWRATIAHADLADWITVAAYLLGALLSARASRHAWLQRIPRETLFWRLTAALLLFLAINELLDLQTLLTMIGRAHAKAHGWYPQHRRIQYIFVIALAFGALLFGAVMLWLTRQMHAGIRLALAGLLFIGLFILLRAASFHHLDDILGRGATEFPLGSIQEMVGILIVAAAALFYTRGRPVARGGRGSLGD